MRTVIFMLFLFTLSCTGKPKDAPETNSADAFKIQEYLVDDRESKNPEIDLVMEKIYSNTFQLVIAYNPEKSYDQRWYYDNEFFSVSLQERGISFINGSDPKKIKLGKTIIDITPILLEAAGVTSIKGYLLIGYPDSSIAGYNLLFVDKSGLDAGLNMNRFFNTDIYNTNQEAVQ
ncbi:MAG: hypothetical protein A2Y33_15510 [Spirochaetes bacterium GWF1_51_8]|nr:MAG: hypothetical protein A2Y33_15510 [Spirochaetes bacterium GWF1_51_8]